MVNEDWIEYAISELDRVTECDAANAVREMQKELRRTKRALWLARAMRAKDKYSSIWMLNELWEYSSRKRIRYTQYERWQWVERKCREKAKEFE